MLSKLKGFLSGTNALLLLPVLLYFLLLLMITPGTFHASDSGLWRFWARYAAENGITQIYHSGADYPPVYLYVLYAFEQFFGSNEEMVLHFDRLKWITLIFDFLPVFLMIFAGMRDQMRRNLHWYLLFNFAYLYNTLVWGQVDAIHTSLCLLMLLLAVRHPAAAMAVFVVALNTKVQSVIFLPLLGIMYWPHLRAPRIIMKILATAVVTELAVVSPLILAGELPNYFRIFVNSVDAYPVASMNAFNLWYLVVTGDPMTTSDQSEFMHLTYKNWGLILFFSSSIVILLPFFLRIIKTGTEALMDEKNQALVFLAAGLVCLGFFFFNTQMHERYSHPAMVFFFFYALKSRNYVPYVLVSVAYLLNMEGVLEFFRVTHKAFYFAPPLIATLYLITLAWTMFLLIKDYPYRGIKALKATESTAIKRKKTA